MNLDEPAGSRQDHRFKSAGLDDNMVTVPPTLAWRTVIAIALVQA